MSGRSLPRLPWRGAPLALRRAGADQRGVRRLETIAPESATALGDASARGCAMALRRAVQLYRDFRVDRPPANQRPQHEAEVLAYVEAVIDRAPPPALHAT